MYILVYENTINIIHKIMLKGTIEETKISYYLYWLFIFTLFKSSKVLWMSKKLN